MTKMKIKDLCNKLKQDVTEKNLFFKELSSPVFLEYFYKENVISFVDDASYSVIQYLQRVYSNDTKEILIRIINKALNKINVNEISFSAYVNLKDLVRLFDDDSFKKINIYKLLKHQYSIELMSFLFEKDITYDNKLCKLSIDSILAYKIQKNSYKQKPLIRYDNYLLSNILKNEKTKKNFIRVLCQNNIFDILVKKYNKIYYETCIEKNTISDIFNLQTINTEEFEKNICKDYSVDNVLDIIIYFLCLHLQENKQDVSAKINVLFRNKIFILRKVGLYIINTNVDKYINLLNIFFDNVNRNNIVKVIDICLYEIVSILKKINDTDIYKDINYQIRLFLDKIPKKEEHLKYHVLHGLKEHSTFKEEFKHLKAKYQYEKEHPGIYYESGIGGWVTNVSPIEKNTFVQMSIEEQINYLNSDIVYNHKLTQIDKDNVAEVNEDGLARLFKDVASENINKYLNDTNICCLNKKIFIKFFIEAISKNILNIEVFDNVVRFIDSFWESLIGDIENEIDLLFEIYSLFLEILEKKKEKFHLFIKYIEEIARSYFDNKLNNEEVSFIALNTVQGQNARCYMDYLVNNTEIINNNNSFLSYLLDKNNEKYFYSFYYYLGVQYQFLTIRFPELNLKNRVYNLCENTKEFFLSGYLSYCNRIDAFKELKALVLDAFKNNEIKEQPIRARFVNMLIELKLQFNEDDIFEEFSKFFSENDYENILHRIIYVDNSNYPKEKVLEFWNEIMDMKNETYVTSLLAIFNKFCTTEEIENYENELIKIIEIGLPENLAISTSIQEFLEKLLSFTKVEKKYITTFNILNCFIQKMDNTKYIHRELTVIKSILIELKNNGEETNAKLLAERIYNTPNLKSHSSIFKEFLIH